MPVPSFVQHDPYLGPFRAVIENRIGKSREFRKKILGDGQNLTNFANGHHYFGRHKTQDGWALREWAPNATGIQLVGTRMGWNNQLQDYSFKSIGEHSWELRLPSTDLQHLDEYKLLISWPGGQGFRLSPWATRVIQDPDSKLFNEQVWAPDHPFVMTCPPSVRNPGWIPLVYEAHVGMSSEMEEVSTWTAFRQRILPYIKKSGYNTIQLMAVQEHPYYGSFGYHVSGFFAASSRFGTPDELKELIDEAHHLGMAVIMDIVHSHAVKNTLEGPGLFDGKPGMFFHTDHRREHPAWDSLCFDYGKPETVHFLLSNCKYWLDEFGFDGFRFDGVTSMLYYDHGLERSFNS